MAGTALRSCFSRWKRLAKAPTGPLPSWACLRYCGACLANFTPWVVMGAATAAPIPTKIRKKTAVTARIAVPRPNPIRSSRMTTGLSTSAMKVARTRSKTTSCSR